MILGAGETSELTARALADRGAGTIFVANRHADRALGLAQRFGGTVVGLDGLPEQLETADIVALLDLLAAPDRRPRRARAGDAPSAEHRPLLLIDIAVPRDIDPRCARARGREPVRHRRPAGGDRAQLSTRARARSPRAQEIVEEEIHRFARWLGQLDVLPTITALREHGDALVDAGARGERRPLGVGLAARPRARRGDRPGGHEPPAARADDPPAKPHGRARPREHRARARAVRAARGRAERQERRRRISPRCTTAPSERPTPPALMRIGTRGSALALAQAQRPWPSDLQGAEIVTLATSGDRGAAAAPTSRRWVDAIEERAARDARSTSRCTPPRTSPASSPTV